MVRVRFVLSFSKKINNDEKQNKILLKNFESSPNSQKRPRICVDVGDRSKTQPTRNPIRAVLDMKVHSVVRKVTR